MLKITYPFTLSTSLNTLRTSRKLCHRTPLTITAHALISFAASGYCCMASYRCLCVTICTTRLYFTRCEGVKEHGYRDSKLSRRRELRFSLKPEILSIVTDAWNLGAVQAVDFLLDKSGRGV